MKAKFTVTFKGHAHNSDGSAREEMQVVYTKTGFPHGNVIGNTYVFDNATVADEWIEDQRAEAEEINNRI